MEEQSNSPKRSEKSGILAVVESVLEVAAEVPEAAVRLRVGHDQDPVVAPHPDLDPADDPLLLNPMPVLIVIVHDQIAVAVLDLDPADLRVSTPPRL